MPLGTSLPFGLRDIKLVEYPTLEAISFGSTLVDLPNARTMSFNDTEEYTELRGDDKLVTSHGQGSTIEWEIESGGVSFAAHRIIAGGTVTETGITPNQRKRLRKKSLDQRPFFVALGQAISDAGGDLHAILYLCRSTGNVEAQMADTEFMLPSVSGTGFPCRVTGQIDGVEINDTVYDWLQNEAITNLAAPVLDTPLAPTVYSLSDVAGPAAGGEVIIAYGERFVGVTNVHMGVTVVTDWEVLSPTQIALISPAKTAGPYNVRVTNATGQSATAAGNLYTYS